ncbi:MAG: DUF1214 domain-containing protein [Myxococcales bacterium]|nr:DUF1214 domain-containing protein [Myxococcales bacterium]
MRKLLISTLNGYRRASRWWLSVRGRTPADDATARVVSGEAWAEFCDTLKAAGAALSYPGTPQGALDQAEGYRYLSRLARAGLEAFVEHADPARPVLHRVVHETAKLGSDNPDNHYLTAAISGALEYRIRGQRGTVAYLAFGTQHGGYGRNGGLPPTGYLEASELELAEDGTFEIIVSARRHPGNWLPMTAETGALIVRQTYLDRATERLAALEITCLSPEARPQQLTPQALEEGLRTTGMFVAGASLLFARWAHGFQRHSNTLPLFDPERSNQAGGDPHIRYYHSHWALGPDEALVIEATPPPCQHWNFQLNNHWMESLDYRYFTVHVNKHTAVYERDGSVRIVVAHRDPGLPNWINTVGHSSGTMCFRWVRAEHHPQPQTRVLTIAALAELARARTSVAEERGS